MEIYALYGPSGTGKSTSALALAHKYQIQAIIDDGLLIYQGRKVAGQSAKYEKTTVQAVKRAIFFWKDHAEEIKKALTHYPIERLLILGTSQKMIQRIQDALEIPSIQHYISITDIRSSAEIKAALYDRGMQGRHVIPIPRVQVEQDFIHRLIARVDKIFSPKKEVIGETTIVHPQFHTGKVHVSENALKRLAIHSCKELPFIAEFRKVRVSLEKAPTVEIDVKAVLELEENLQEKAHAMQQHIFHAFLEYLDLQLENINIYISQIEMKVPAHKPAPVALPSHF